MADQHQQDFDDDRRFQRGRSLAGTSPGEALPALAPLGVPDRGVAGEIDPDAAEALALQRLLAEAGQQERMHGHVQQGLQFLLRAPGQC